jgi:hypothetical protein
VLKIVQELKTELSQHASKIASLLDPLLMSVILVTILVMLTVLCFQPLAQKCALRWKTQLLVFLALRSALLPTTRFWLIVSQHVIVLETVRMAAMIVMIHVKHKVLQTLQVFAQTSASVKQMLTIVLHAQTHAWLL